MLTMSISTGLYPTLDLRNANKLHYITLHYITLHYITLHYITLHYITLHYITLHYITLHYITLHYITLLSCSIRRRVAWKRFIGTSEKQLSPPLGQNIN